MTNCKASCFVLYVIKTGFHDTPWLFFWVFDAKVHMSLDFVLQLSAALLEAMILTYLLTSRGCDAWLQSQHVREIRALCTPWCASKKSIFRRTMLMQTTTCQNTSRHLTAKLIVSLLVKLRMPTVKGRQFCFFATPKKQLKWPLT